MMVLTSHHSAHGSWRRTAFVGLAVVALACIAAVTATALDARLVGIVALAVPLAVVVVASEPQPLAPVAPSGPLLSRTFLIGAWIALLLLPEMRLISQGRGRSPHSVVQGDISVDIALELGAVAVVGLALAWKVATRWPTRIPPIVGLVGALSVMAVASVTWSALPLVTMARSAQLAVITLLGAATVGVATVDPARARRLLDGVSRAFILATLALGILAMLTPDHRHGRLRWPGTHPIAAATIFGVALLLLLAARHRKSLTRPIPWQLVVAVLGVFILLTESRGPLGATLAGIGAIALQRSRGDARIAAIVSSGTGAAVAGATVLAGGVVGTYLLRGQTIEQARTLTGRTTLWSHILDNPIGSWIWGVGYGGNRTALLDDFHWAGHAHGAWIDLLQTLGVIGTAIMAASLVAATVLALRWRSSTAFALLAFTIVSSITSSAFAGPGLLTGTILLALAWMYVDGIREPGPSPPTALPTERPSDRDRTLVTRPGVVAG